MTIINKIRVFILLILGLGFCNIVVYTEDASQQVTYMSNESTYEGPNTIETELYAEVVEYYVISVPISINVWDLKTNESIQTGYSVKGDIAEDKKVVVSISGDTDTLTTGDSTETGCFVFLKDTLGGKEDIPVKLEISRNDFNGIDISHTQTETLTITRKGTLTAGNWKSKFNWIVTLEDI